ncbi:MAG: DNA mismatch repair endonuclease MutL, partial [Candidatus Hodarchaeales archaeon]
MESIHILDPLVISKIAAGEVIERPASVVKELIENAIDASATEISVNIKKGGKDFMEIKDNGKGIRSIDVPISIKRHSTSKINTADDLSIIKTMGFRGEALYSIASISRFSLTTRTSNEEIATRITLEGNVDEYKLTEEVLSSPGTVIQVNDLFFNFIVRRKFLKKPNIEQGYIYDVIVQYIIAYPGISFKLIADGKELLHSIKSNDYMHPIRNIFGLEMKESLIDLGIAGFDDITILGFISKPGKHKRNRKFQFIYLNQRRIYSRIIQDAIEEGYGNYLMKGEFPMIFLFIDFDPQNYDVNIHPQKREVLFYNENNIKKAVSTAINHCLKTQNLVPEFISISTKKKQALLNFKKVKSSFKEKPTSIPKIKLHHPISQTEIMKDISESKFRRDILERKATVNIIGSNVRFRGHLGKEFILLEDITNNDLVILDFHAAHERINLERLLKLFKTDKIPIQLLLQPLEINGQFIDDPLISQLRSLGFKLK